MNATKYTPGPWIVKEGCYVYAPDGSTVAKTTGNMKAYQESEQTAKANARLIAAAPDMLEALVACDKAFVSWQLGQIPGRPEDILALITQVRETLKKAKGEKP